MENGYRITDEAFPEYEVLSLRGKQPIGAMGKMIGGLYALARSRALKPAGPLFAVYFEKPAAPAAPVDYALYLPVEGDAAKLDALETYGGDACLKLRLTGSYRGFAEAYAALEAEVGKRGLTLAGPPREVYVRGPLFGFLTFIPIMVTDIYFPVKAAQ
jgi:effector-binding domain-containing protein